MKKEMLPSKGAFFVILNGFSYFAEQVCARIFAQIESAEKVGRTFGESVRIKRRFAEKRIFFAVFATKSKTCYFSVFFLKRWG